MMRRGSRLLALLPSFSSCRHVRSCPRRQTVPNEPPAAHLLLHAGRPHLRRRDRRSPSTPRARATRTARSSPTCGTSETARVEDDEHDPAISHVFPDTGVPLPQHHLRRVARRRRRPGRTGGRVPNVTVTELPAPTALECQPAEDARMAAVVVGGAVRRRAPAGAAPAGAAEQESPAPLQAGPVPRDPQLRLASGIDTNVFQTLARPDPRRGTGAEPAPGRGAARRPAAAHLGLRRSSTSSTSGARTTSGPPTSTARARPELDLGRLDSLRRRRRRPVHAAVLDRRRRAPQAPGEDALTPGSPGGSAGKLSLTARGRDEVVTFAPGEFRLGGDIKEAMDRNTLARDAASSATRSRRRTTLLGSAGSARGPLLQPAGRTSRASGESYRYLGGFEFGGPRAAVDRPAAGGAAATSPGPLAEGSPPYRGPSSRPTLALPLAQRARGCRVLRRTRRVLRVEPGGGGALRYRNAFIYERLLGEATFDLPLDLLGSCSCAASRRPAICFPIRIPDHFHLATRVDHRWTGGLGLAPPLRRLPPHRRPRDLGAPGEQPRRLLLRRAALRPHRARYLP